MSIDTPSRIQDQQSSHQAKNTMLLSIMHLEPHDTIEAVLDFLHAHTAPVLLVLSPSGELFRLEKHFAMLRLWMTAHDHAFGFCFVFSSRQMNEKHLAEHYGFRYASSVEEAIQSLMQTIPFETHSPLEAKTATFSISSNTLTHTPFYTAIQDRAKETIYPQYTPDKKQQYRLIAFLTVLILASGLFLPLIFLSIPSQLQAGTPTIIGNVTFTSSGQVDPTMSVGYNDVLTLTLQHLPLPHSGMAYFAWLMPDVSDDQTPPLFLGRLHIQAGNVLLRYAPSQHTNLFARYSGLRITEEPEATTSTLPSQNPGTWRWEGWIPDMPTPGDAKHNSLLSHLRHLLAEEPTLRANGLSGGLATWLTRNIAKVEEWASAAQGQWQGPQTTSGDADLIHRHMLRILDYLDGQRYSWRDVPAGSPWVVDPLAGTFGILSLVPGQNPPGFLEHVDLHLTGLAHAPGHTPAQQQLAIKIDDIIRVMTQTLQSIRQDAIQVVKMNPDQVRQPETLMLLNQMNQEAIMVQSGWLDARMGENIGGSLWLSTQLQQLATIPLHASMAQ